MSYGKVDNRQLINNGEVATVFSTIATAGALNDVATTGTSAIRFTGATSVTGFANGSSGKKLSIINRTGGVLTVSNQNNSSSADNRIITGTGADISLANGSAIDLTYDSTTLRWNVIGDWTSGTGLALNYMRRTNGLTRGSTNTNVVIYGTAAESNGSDITYNNSATNGDSFTINTSGIYSITAGNGSGSTQRTSINVGAAIGNSAAASTTRADCSSGSAPCSASWTGYIASGQIVWIIATVSPAGSVDINQITIARLV